MANKFIPSHIHTHPHNPSVIYAYIMAGIPDITKRVSSQGYIECIYTGTPADTIKRIRTEIADTIDAIGSSRTGSGKFGVMRL